MLITVIMFLTIIFLPRLIILATDKIAICNTLGSVFLCYIVGLLLSFVFKAGGANIALAADFSSVLVCIAMPLILFSADLPALKKLARPMLLSFGMNCVAVVVIAVAAFFLLMSIVPETETISAMLIGTYIGGTPNMVVIGKAMGAGNSQILLLQSADMIAGGTYFLLLLSAMPWLAKKLLRPYIPVGGDRQMLADTERYAQEFSGRKRKIKPWREFFNRAGLVGLSLLCFAVAAGVCLLLPSQYGNTGLAKLSEYTVIIMLVVTTGGILLSFVKRVRNTPGSYSTGIYFILMFSVVIGISFDLSLIGLVLRMLAMALIVQYGAVLLHLLMARLAKIDAHTMVITSCAGIFGPPFIIPVAKALGNDEIILPGILCGILGLALGNYVGIGVGDLLRLFG